jgi:acetolactate synthase-1/2/3 large subunit
MQELARAVQHRITLITIVFNNRRFGNVRRDQHEQYGGRLLGADLVNPDFLKLTESFGALGLRAATPAALKVQLERALNADRPAVIEVPGEPGNETSPWPFLHPAPHIDR